MRVVEQMQAATSGLCAPLLGPFDPATALLKLTDSAAGPPPPPPTTTHNPAVPVLYCTALTHCHHHVLGSLLRPLPHHITSSGADPPPCRLPPSPAHPPAPAATCRSARPPPPPPTRCTCCSSLGGGRGGEREGREGSRAEGSEQGKKRGSDNGHSFCLLLRSARRAQRRRALGEAQISRQAGGAGLPATHSRPVSLHPPHPAPRLPS